MAQNLVCSFISFLSQPSKISYAPGFKYQQYIDDSQVYIYCLNCFLHVQVRVCTCTQPTLSWEVCKGPYASPVSHWPSSCTSHPSILSPSVNGILIFLLLRSETLGLSLTWFFLSILFLVCHWIVFATIKSNLEAADFLLTSHSHSGTSHLYLSSRL